MTLGQIVGFGKGSIMRLGDNRAMDVDHPTGSLSLDIAWVRWPSMGRIVEIYGLSVR